MNEWDRNNPIATFVRARRKQVGLSQIQLSDFTGLGLRFIREVEQGKPSIRLDKVNYLLLFFGTELKPIPISDEKRQRLGE
ncbi:MAG: helix-turn-helix transcriptional regulator [Bacteroidota bacterium]